MLSKLMPFALMAAGMLSAPAFAAGSITCKVEESKIVFKIQDQGTTANVLVGTLTSTPKLIFKNVPLRTEADQTVVVVASPEQQVGTTDKLKCADLQKFFRLVLKPKAGGKYSGEITMSPYFRPGSDRTNGCKGFAAPEMVDDQFVNVVCLRSN